MSVAGIILIIGISLIAVWWRHEWKLVVLGFCMVFLVLGIYRYFYTSRDELDTTHISFYNNTDQDVIIRGMIVGEPDERSSSVKYEIESSVIIIEGITREARGKILITSHKYPQYRYGDFVELNGRLQTPKDFPDFSYKDYLSRYKVYSIVYYPQSMLLDRDRGNGVYTKVLVAKKSFQENIDTILPDPHSSFLSGLLLGTKKQIPENLIEKFNRTGTTHIVAISGYNITIIAVIIMNCLLYIGLHRYWAFWLAVCGIIMFAVLTGGSASVVRASIMGIIVLMANRLGRLSRVTHALILSGVIMVAVNPKILRFDAGFQLSFLATLGIVYFSPVLENIFERFLRSMKKISQGKVVVTSFITTISAQILVIPVIAYDFGRISLISPFANILVLPIIPITMLVGFISGILGFIWLPVAKVFGYLTWVFLQYEIKIIEILARIPLASVEVKNVGWIFVVVYYGGVFVIYYMLKKYVFLLKN